MVLKYFVKREDVCLEKDTVRVEENKTNIYYLE